MAVADQFLSLACTYKKKKIIIFLKKMIYAADVVGSVAYIEYCSVTQRSVLTSMSSPANVLQISEHQILH